MKKVLTNFGAINGQRVITFAKTADHSKVIPAKYRRMKDEDGGIYELNKAGLLITAREAFRRWKAARKAWSKRKWGKQLPLPL